MKYLAIIPARAGSKRIKDKNIKNLAGKPLIYYTINAAKESILSKEENRIYISTDSEKIKLIAEDLGGNVPYLRSEEFANDTACSFGFIKEMVDFVSEDAEFPENIILLQPTSPLRRSEDIDNAIRKFEESKSDFLVSITQVMEHPYYFYRINDGVLIPFTEEYEDELFRSQELEEVYRLNGAIYIANTKEYLSRKTFLTPETDYYVMPKNRSIDIDNEDDWRLAEFLLKRSES